MKAHIPPTITNEYPLKDALIYAAKSVIVLVGISNVAATEKPPIIIIPDVSIITIVKKLFILFSFWFRQHYNHRIVFVNTS